MALQAELNRTTSGSLTTGNIVLVHAVSGDDIEWITVTATVDAFIYVYDADETPPADNAATPSNRGLPWPAQAPYAHRVDSGTLFVEGQSSAGTIGALGTDR